MQIQLAHVQADPLTLDKRPFMEDPITTTVQINNPVNVDTPHFILNISGVFNYNYAYVQKWGKYYYLGEPTYLDGNRLTVQGACDVLTSYADQIKEIPVNVTRTTGTGKNTKMLDNMQPSQVNRYCYTIEATDSRIYTANPDDIRYVLTVQGGAHR